MACLLLEINGLLVSAAFMCPLKGVHLAVSSASRLQNMLVSFLVSRRYDGAGNGLAPMMAAHQVAVLASVIELQLEDAEEIDLPT